MTVGIYKFTNNQLAGSDIAIYSQHDNRPKEAAIKLLQGQSTKRNGVEGFIEAQKEVYITKGTEIHEEADFIYEIDEKADMLTAYHKENEEFWAFYVGTITNFINDFSQITKH